MSTQVMSLENKAAKRVTRCFDHLLYYLLAAKLNNDDIPLSLSFAHYSY